MNYSYITKLANCPLWTITKSLLLEVRLNFEGIRWYYIHVHRNAIPFMTISPSQPPATFQISHLHEIKSLVGNEALLHHILHKLNFTVPLSKVWLRFKSYWT